jgi:hypothetical protein
VKVIARTVSNDTKDYTETQNSENQMSPSPRVAEVGFKSGSITPNNSKVADCQSWARNVAPSIRDGSLELDRNMESL